MIKNQVNEIITETKYRLNIQFTRKLKTIKICQWRHRIWPKTSDIKLNLPVIWILYCLNMNPKWAKAFHIYIHHAYACIHCAFPNIYIVCCVCICSTCHEETFLIIFITKIKKTLIWMWDHSNSVWADQQQYCKVYLPIWSDCMALKAQKEAKNAPPRQAPYFQTDVHRHQGT